MSNHSIGFTIDKIKRLSFAISTIIWCLSQNITLMIDKEGLKIRSWIEQLQRKGKHAFSLGLLEEELPSYTSTGYKRALSRLSAKGKIVSIYKGYYLIVPPQYASRGILPPAIFLDSFMKYLGRPYYLALLNAAAYHGAAHQQPQEFFVVINLPSMRQMFKKGLKINYLIKKEIPNSFLEKRKTESGYLTLSNPVLTAADLFIYEQRVGGINRIATILTELVETMEPEDFKVELINSLPISALQRLGFILEHAIENNILADALYESLRQSGEEFYRIPLKVKASTKGLSSDKRWKVIANTQIEMDV